MNADTTIERCPGAAMPARDSNTEVNDGIGTLRQGDRELFEILAVEREHEARLRMRRQRRLARAGDELAAAREAELAQGVSTPALTPDIELELAARDASLGRREEAQRRYEAVLNVLEASTPLGATAAFRLAHLLLEQRQHRNAVDLLERALHGADTSLRPHIEFALAGELDSVRYRGRVQELYEAALLSDHPDLAPGAAVVLGALRESDGDLAMAAHFYELAIRSEHPVHGVDALARLNALMHGRAIQAIGDAMRCVPWPRDTNTVEASERDAARVSHESSPCCQLCSTHAHGHDGHQASSSRQFTLSVPMYGLRTSGVELANASFLLGAITDALALARCELALVTGSLWDGGPWSSALDRRQPGVAAWGKVFDGCDCGHGHGSGRMLRSTDS